MAELLQTVEIEPDSPARCSVIWLHGLGADAHDFPPIVPELGLDPAIPVRFVFPHAPKIPVTVNAGMAMRAWYDITELDLRRRNDEKGVLRSVENMKALIARENERGVPSERILIAGFSQGGAIALHVALKHPERLLGAIALSTYLVCEESLLARLSSANRGLPIFHAHGLQDPVVPIERGRAAGDKLLELGYASSWHAYPMQHQVCWEEIQDLGSWMRERFAAAG